MRYLPRPCKEKGNQLFEINFFKVLQMKIRNKKRIHKKNSRLRRKQAMQTQHVIVQRLNDCLFVFWLRVFFVCFLVCLLSFLLLVCLFVRSFPKKFIATPSKMNVANSTTRFLRLVGGPAVWLSWELIIRSTQTSAAKHIVSAKVTFRRRSHKNRIF